MRPLNPLERAKIDAEIAELIAELKRRLAERQQKDKVRPALPDTAVDRIMKEMDEGIVRNVRRNREIQERKKVERMAARKSAHPPAATNPNRPPTPCTPARRVSDAEHQKVSDEMTRAFRKNVATSRKRKANQERQGQKLTEEFATAIAAGLRQTQQQAAKKSDTPRMADAIYREGQEPDPVNAENQLQGLETEVLKVWTQEPATRKAHQADPSMVEGAVRRAVFDALREEAALKAQGLQPHEAEEFTRPAMWKAPAFPKP
jgi:hypothetical protein